MVGDFELNLVAAAMMAEGWRSSGTTCRVSSPVGLRV